MRVYLFYVDGVLNNEDALESFYSSIKNDYILKENKYYSIIINAQYGHANNREAVKEYIQKAKKTKKDLFILTNQITLLNLDECWNGKYHDIYLYDQDTDEFILLKDLTSKYLRAAHNIMKMYIAGSFDFEYYYNNHKKD